MLQLPGYTLFTNKYINCNDELFSFALRLFCITYLQVHKVRKPPKPRTVPPVEDNSISCDLI